MGVFGARYFLTLAQHDILALEKIMHSTHLRNGLGTFRPVTQTCLTQVLKNITFVDANSEFMHLLGVSYRISMQSRMY